MPTATVLISGDRSPAEAIHKALLEADIAADVQPAGALADALTDLESHIEASQPGAVVAVGSGDAALAIAITAAKAGVPLAVLSTGSDPADNHGRILATLADLDAGSDPERGADLIAAWLR